MPTVSFCWVRSKNAFSVGQPASGLAWQITLSVSVIGSSGGGAGS